MSDYPWDAPMAHDRSGMSSPVATIDWSSSTRGTYRKLQGADLLFTHGPQGKLSAKNSLEQASIEVVEEFAPWSTSLGYAATKYLISMYDDYQYLKEVDDYTTTYYTGFAGDATTEGRATLNALGASVSINEYSMYLKRATIVPVGLPRTTRTADFETDAAKLAGFLDPNDYFRYTCNFQYYGEKEGWNDYTHMSDAATNTIEWQHIGAINQNDQEPSAAGSWNTLRETFYANDRTQAEGIGSGHYGGAKSTPSLLYTAEAMRYALSWSKSLIKIQETSMLHASAHLSDTPPSTTPQVPPSQEFLTSRGMNPKDMSWQSDQHHAGYTDNHCGAIGAFLYEYCGPLYDHNCLINGHMAPSSGYLTNLTNPAFGMPSPIHIQETARQPYVQPWEIHADNEHETTATFTSGRGNVQLALEIRFDSDTVSTNRANAYIDYYTGYLYEQVEHEPIPREYKTKMQATPELDRNLISAVRGTRATTDSTPSTFATSTAGSTPTMGSSY